ncbi:MAG: hypothetical protein FWD76_03525, partial [Firmicutes bacterium]|nr:hypothetical protein [Bacillota bacterium]
MYYNKTMDKLLVESLAFPKIKIGPKNLAKNDFLMIAGPCSIESEEHFFATAKSVLTHGATLLRGGAFKPRTSPHSFQGLGKEGIAILLRAKKHFGTPVICEIMDIGDLPLYDDVDILQVGARSALHYPLLKELSKLQKPILLKRGLGASVQEWLLGAEYLLQGGNH